MEMEIDNDTIVVKFKIVTSGGLLLIN